MIARAGSLGGMELNWQALAGGRSYLVQTYKFGDLWVVSVPELPTMAYADAVEELAATARTAVGAMLGVAAEDVELGGAELAAQREAVERTVEQVQLDAARGLAEIRRRKGVPERRNGSFSRASRQCSFAHGEPKGQSRWIG